MWETSFSYASATAIPPNVSIENAVATLHDFDVVVRLSPDCRGCKPIPPPKNGYARHNNVNGDEAAKIQYYEVEDDLPFMPKRMWAGGVRYQADFTPVDDGCDITVHAPAGFTSTNHWRLVRESIPEDQEMTLDRVETKDLDHAVTTGSGWYVQIISDAKCNKTFAGIIKGFLRNSHAQLQQAFIERLKQRPQMGQRRPTLGRRRSSKF